MRPADVEQQVTVTTSAERPVLPGSSVTVSPCHRVTVSPTRAWLALVALSLQRQARMRQMVWIALALLVLVTAFVTVISHTPRLGWGVANRRLVVRSAEARAMATAMRPPGAVPQLPVWVTTYGQYLNDWQGVTAGLPQPTPAA